MDPSEVTDEGTLKRSLLQDITNFLRNFNSDSLIKYSDFRSKWDELDFDLLSILAGPDSITSCLIQLGLFGPTRSFPDHQFLVFFLFSMRKASRKGIKLSVDRMQFLLGVRMRARMMNDGEGDEVIEALESLFKLDSFIITAVSDFTEKYISPAPCSATILTSADQLIDRINRIDNFIHLHPLLSPTGSSSTLSRSSLARLNASFERYYESKKRNRVVLADEQDFGALLRRIGGIVEGYEKLIQKRQFNATAQSPSSINPSNAAAPATATQSIRSRLSRSSFKPVTPSSTSSLFLPQISTLRPQSVPLGIKSNRKLKEIDLEEFMDTSTVTNMPSINFY